VDDPRLQDRVADNAAKKEIIEGESLHREGLRGSAPTLKADAVGGVGDVEVE
jgi:hypothetical protein